MNVIFHNLSSQVNNTKGAAVCSYRNKTKKNNHSKPHHYVCGNVYFFAHVHILNTLSTALQSIIPLFNTLLYSHIHAETLHVLSTSGGTHTNKLCLNFYTYKEQKAIIFQASVISGIFEVLQSRSARERFLMKSLNRTKSRLHAAKLCRRVLTLKISIQLGHYSNSCHI